MVHIHLTLWLLCFSLCGFWVPVVSANCVEPEPLLDGGVIFISGTDNQHLSVIQYHCNEPYYTFPGGVNVTYTCASDGKWRNDNDSSEIPKCIPVCGRPVATTERYQRILGGDVAADNTFPWHVGLTNGHQNGGAMVVGEYWVLTGTTNVYDSETTQVPSKPLLKLYVGNNELETLLQSTPLEVASIHSHPGYSDKFDNDITLIRLKHPIKFNASVMPVCLPPVNASYTAGRIGIVSGFGRMSWSRMPTNLQYVQLPLVDQEKCSESLFPDATKSEQASFITKNMICAGLPEGGKDACMGDSGGAFVLKNDGSYWAAGIVSWGKGCGQPGQYGVYTRVGNYRDWIIKTMQEN